MTDQTSLESEYGKQECPNTEKFVMTEPVRKCRLCKKYKPLDQFRLYSLSSLKNGRAHTCKSCDAERSLDYRWRHIDKMRKHDRKYHNENRFIKRSIGKYKIGLFYGTGICLLCGESYPLYLENHHVVPWDDDFVLSLCANCHKKYFSSIQNKHMSNVANAIENSKFLWDSDGQPKGLKPIPMWTADLPLKEAIQILKSYDLPGYEPISI